MAYCKSAMDAGAEIQHGTIVTVLTRNGKNFGVKISGMGDQWFTAPVNTPEGLFSQVTAKLMPTQILVTAQSLRRSVSAVQRW